MDVDRYLDRIGFDGVRDPSLQLLRALHVAHLSSVPFENLSIHSKERIELSSEWLFDKIVARRRGGFCYELNGLFAELLLALGFRVDRLAAQVYKQDRELGIPFDHLCLRVELEGEAFLADVGFGECFVLPLRFEDGEQQDGRTRFRIEDHDLWMLDREGSWKRQYRFELTPHPLSAFEGGCLHHQTSDESPFTKKRVCSLLTATGRITLSEDRFIERIGSEVSERTIEERERKALLFDRFGIRSEP